MKILKVELQGFKSFVTKTTINFTDGVTAIVGPNGCGKSNIADAFLWVMGEQSAKELRGGSMEDVIFNGTEDTPQLSFAEVSLTFTKEGVILPPQYEKFPELMITRRLYRSGESEYLINKIPCRLKDITEIFMDTGVGVRAYSFIKQGRVEEMMSMKPEERRSIIEEAAGITKYKSRKREAERKMGATGQNLLRIGDIIGEYQKQLNSLKRQADKANRYKKLREQGRGIELFIANFENKKLNKRLGSLEEEISSHRERMLSTTSNLDKAESLLVEQKRVVLDSERIVRESEKKVSEQTLFIQRCENETKMHEKEVEMLINQDERITEELASLESKIDEVTEEVNYHDNMRADLQIELESLKEKTGELESLYSEKSTELGNFEEGLEADRKEHLNTQYETSRIQNNIKFLQERKDEANRKIESASVKEEEVHRELESARTEETETERCLLEKEEHISSLEERLSLNEKNILSIQKEKENLDASLSETREKLNEIRTELYGLELLEEKFEGLQDGIKAILASFDTPTPEEGTGKPKLVVDAINVDPGMEKAVTSFLEDRLQVLLAADREEVFHFLDYLKTGGSGQAGFMLPSTPDTNKIPSRTPESGNEKILGTLNDFTSIDSGSPHRDNISSILERAFVVKDLSTAFELHETYPEFDFVTADGEKIDRLGVIHGGEVIDSKTGILGRRREIEALKNESDSVKEKISLMEEELKKISENENSFQEEGRGLNSEILHSRETKSEIEKKLVGLQSETKLLDEKRSILDFEKMNLKKETESLDRDLDDDIRKLENVASIGDELGRKLDSSKTKNEELKDAFSKVGEELTQQKIKLEQTIYKKDHTSKMLSDKKRELEEHRGRVTSLKSEQQRVKEKQKGSIEKISELNDELLKGDMQKKVVSEELEKHTQSHSRELEKISSLEEEIREKRKSADSLKETISGLQIEKTSVSGNRDNLRERIFERHQFNIDEYEKDENTDRETILKKIPGDDDEERISSLKTELETINTKKDKLGEVNLAAVSEYEELKGRCEFVKEQKNDLEETLNNLRDTINKINKESQSLFVGTFKKVNENFRNIFPILFNGGKAELVLTDPSNWLESGVDIIAQPPGKKLQNLNLLSGGEKAMAAVSLIFALFQNRPSPFCLLDEVDAPLDDANIDKYNKMVKKMSANTQFVIVTHNKRTMEVGDTLYGVTMEKKGISKMVSVKLGGVGNT